MGYLEKWNVAYVGYSRGRMRIRQVLMVGVHAPGALGRHSYVTIGERNLFSSDNERLVFVSLRNSRLPLKTNGGHSLST